MYINILQNSIKGYTLLKKQPPLKLKSASRIASADRFLGAAAAPQAVMMLVLQNLRCVRKKT